MENDLALGVSERAEDPVLNSLIEEKGASKTDDNVQELEGLPSDIIEDINPALLKQFNDVVEDEYLLNRLKSFKNKYDNSSDKDKGSILSRVKGAGSPMKKLKTILQIGDSHYNSSRYGRIQACGGADNYMDRLEDQIRKDHEKLSKMKDKNDKEKEEIISKSNDFTYTHDYNNDIDVLY